MIGQNESVARGYRSLGGRDWQPEQGGCVYVADFAPIEARVRDENINSAGQEAKKQSVAIQ